MQNTLNQGETFPPRSISVTHNYPVVSHMTITCSSSWCEIQQQFKHMSFLSVIPWLRSLKFRTTMTPSNIRIFLWLCWWSSQCWQNNHNLSALLHNNDSWIHQLSITLKKIYQYFAEHSSYHLLRICCLWTGISAASAIGVQLRHIYNLH
jgi:hypothetical protein